MTRGKKPVPQPDVEILDAAGEQQAEQQMAVMRETAIIDERSIVSEVYRLGQLVGARQMALAATQFLRAADIQLFEEISKSKGYKHIPVEHPDGNLRPAENIQDFCRLVFKKSYSVMAESRQTLEALGAECYEIATSLGLKRTQLRLLLSLPEDELEAVKEAMQSESKTEVVTLIQSLANKLDETHAKVEHLKGELKATEEISAEKTQRIEQLQREVKLIAVAPPDEVLAKLQAEATRIGHDARGAIIGQLRQALIALNDHGEETGARQTVFMAGLVGQLLTDLVALRDEFGLPDVDRGEVAWVDGD